MQSTLHNDGIIVRWRVQGSEIFAEATVAFVANVCSKEHLGLASL